VFVQEGIYDEFVKKAVAREKQQVVGKPFEQGAQHDP
jgi:acyl-CoA reductase-like NAD-dependent aldehyde dehydrogenase